MKIWTNYYILFIFYMLCKGVLSEIEGGQCYSQAQISCQDQWTKLIVAQRENQYGSICRHFGDVHSCTLKFTSRCKFQSHEQELYQRDIVRVYTNKPYSCALIGGNLQIRGKDQASATSHLTTSVICLLIANLFHYIS